MTCVRTDLCTFTLDPWIPGFVQSRINRHQRRTRDKITSLDDKLGLGSGRIPIYLCNQNATNRQQRVRRNLWAEAEERDLGRWYFALAGSNFGHSCALALLLHQWSYLGRLTRRPDKIIIESYNIRGPKLELTLNRNAGRRRSITSVVRELPKSYDGISGCPSLLEVSKL